MRRFLPRSPRLFLHATAPQGSTPVGDGPCPFAPARLGACSPRLLARAAQAVAARRAFALAAALTCALALAAAPLALADEVAADTAGATAEASDPAASDWSYFGADDMPTISCAEAIVVTEDGTVLFDRQGNTPMAMASVTKMMTAVVALESGISLDTVFTASTSVWQVYGQTIGIAPDQQITLGDLLKSLLVHSGNDAAVVIAEGVAGSVSSFVDLMNAKAAELGMWNTNYVNPHGLDADGHHSTPADLVTLARYAMQIPEFASIVGSTGTTISMGGEEVSFTSTDELLDVYPGMRGVKTGYTDDAGRTFVGVATRGGQTIYVCVLGCASNDERWADVSNLLDWAFAHTAETTLLSGSAAVGSGLAFADRFGWSVSATTGVDAALRSDAATGEVADTSLSSIWTTEVAGANEVVGELVWSDADGLAAARALVTGLPSVSGANFGPLVSALFGDVS